MDEYEFPPEITIEQGKFVKGDRVLLIKGWKIDYVSLGKAIAFLAANEESRYPQDMGYQGKNKLKDYLNDVIDEGWPTTNIREEYGL